MYMYMYLWILYIYIYIYMFINVYVYIAPAKIISAPNEKQNKGVKRKTLIKRFFLQKINFSTSVSIVIKSIPRLVH